MITYVYPCLFLFTYVYTSLPMSIPGYSCLPMFTRVSLFNRVYSCLPMCTAVCSYVLLFLPMLLVFTYVYTSLPISTSAL